MKKNIFYLLVLVIVAGLLLSGVNKINSEKNVQLSSGNINTDIFGKFGNKSANEIENEIREAEKIRKEQFGGASKAQIDEALGKLEAGEVTLRQLFADTFIAGDSLMNGLEIYGVLSADNLATQVSASLSHLNENLTKIISANPAVLILHYGINMISTDKSQMESFVDSYREIIDELSSSLPDTRIIISGLFPVDTTVATEERFTAVADYNKALSEMCEDAGVEFLDSTKAFEGNSDYYGADGIHLSSGFYSNVWLPFVVENKGIIG